MNNPIEVETVIETKDLNAMLLIAMVYANRAVLPIILGLSFVFSIVNWKLLRFESLSLIILMWLAFAGLIIYLLLRRSHINSRESGALGFVNKPQYFRFYGDHFSLKAPGSQDYVDVSYSRVKQARSVPGFLMIGLDKKHYLFLRKKDLEGRIPEILALIRSTP